jgi:hypothetical protein
LAQQAAPAAQHAAPGLAQQAAPDAPGAPVDPAVPVVQQQLLNASMAAEAARVNRRWIDFMLDGFLQGVDAG